MSNNTINDGDVVGGSRQITIGGQTYETDDFDLSPEIKRYLRTNSQGVPSGKRVILGETTGTATLQYPSSSVNAPTFGATFSVTYNGTPLSCTIEKIGEKSVKEGERKIPVTFSVNITGSVVLSQN